MGLHAAMHLEKKIQGQILQGTSADSALRFCLQPKGFFEQSFPAPLPRAARIRVLLMKGQAADALTSITGRFTKKTNIEVDYTILPPEKIYETCMDPNAVSAFDVIRASVSVLPIMPQQSFRPYAYNCFKAVTAGMAPMIVEPLSIVDGLPYAIPFDVGSQVLVYRKDIFQDPMIKRMYFESFGCNLEPPADFDAFNSVASFFNNSKNPASPVQYGATTSTGTNAQLFLNFILRYRALAGDLCNESKLGGFNYFAASKALAQYLNFYQNAFVLDESDWFGASLHNFINGKSAMEIIAFNYASNITEMHALAANSQIGYSMVPGGHPVLGGGSLLITQQCKEYQAALHFVEWACGPDNAEAFTYMGGVSPHQHVYQSQEILALYPWYRLFGETLDRSSYR